MKQVVCWNPERVAEVINIDADFVLDPVFWAVDSEAPLRIADSEGGPARELSTNALVARFLDPSVGHFQLAILGPAGVGKSHIIQRMRQRIEGRHGFEVLAIRRLETNLRAILEKLIVRLPEDERGRYLEDLQRAGTTLTTVAAQKSALLDSLAQAIEEDAPNPESGIDTEFEQALLAALPNLVRDPHLRRTKFLADGEVVGELVDRLFSAREGKRLDERVVFERQNLPLSGLDMMSCSSLAREAIDLYLYDSERTVPQVLSIINRNLNRAIARALNFSGDQLGELMGRIRTRLKVEGKQLVLLFEEFARLQGYDLAMLSALIVQGDESLCNVRWALACTTGRFRELPDTVRTRMDAVVDLEAAAPRPELPDFTGRYLNAVRVGRPRLEEAFDNDEARIVPNTCTDCVWRSDCFATFGSSREGFGLYPFTEKALAGLARRSGADDGERFNPRDFQKKVLKPILMEEAGNITSGKFPTSGLLAQLGGPEILSVDRTRLQERAGANFDQYLAFYQLWNGGRLDDSSDEALLTFGLTPLKFATVPSGRAPVGGTSVPSGAPKPIISAASDRDPVAVQLGAWVDGGALEQTLAQNLRSALFPLIERAIDWDELGLAPSTFSSATGGSRPFRNQSIQFLRQQTTGGVGSAIRLELPLRRDPQGFTFTALALEVLLKQRSGDWSQAHGLEGLAALSELVAECAAEASQQLLALQGDPTEWDPIAGAVDLLLLGSALGGAFPAGAVSDEKMVETIFRPMPEESPFSDTRLTGLYTRLRAKRGNLQALVRAHVSASKGGRMGRPINPRSIRDAARRLRRQKWSPSRTPAPRPDVYAETGDLYTIVRRDLSVALKGERDLRAAWLAEMDGTFGPDAVKQDIIQQVKAAAEAAIAGGIHAPVQTLTKACEDFAQFQFDAAVRSARIVVAADPPESELPTYARGRRDAVEAASRLVAGLTSFLGAAEAQIAQKRAEAGVEELAQKIARLEGIIDDLVAELEPLDAQS
ncbi:protein DpdH [Mesorhizobium sp.]|uniref:protein DpdH n=1 Tax=Mesorhizobium sp. TaxID=1871066 RepID=UPI000FE98701|nr:protein DpdH [Mesorhizobium sp.]RWO55371.1 MAG: hypothetical protein EOS14_29985 [Mesorhizobium sp.]